MIKTTIARNMRCGKNIIKVWNVNNLPHCQPTTSYHKPAYFSVFVKEVLAFFLETSIYRHIYIYESLFPLVTPSCVNGWTDLTLLFYCICYCQKVLMKVKNSKFARKIRKYPSSLEPWATGDMRRRQGCVG